MYNNLVADKKWKTAHDAKIVALMTKLEQLEKQVLSGNGGTAATTTKSSTIDIVEWRKKKSFGANTTKDGKEWWWCPHQHNGGKGLYVQHSPDDHQSWADKKKLGKSSNGSGTSSGSSNSSSSKNAGCNGH